MVTVYRRIFLPRRHTRIEKTKILCLVQILPKRIVDTSETEIKRTVWVHHEIPFGERMFFLLKHLRETLDDGDPVKREKKEGNKMKGHVEDKLDT